MSILRRGTSKVRTIANEQWPFFVRAGPFFEKSVSSASETHSMGGTPARHNSIGALKMAVFPGDLTPGCQFSQLARWGVDGQKTLELPSF